MADMALSLLSLANMYALDDLKDKCEGLVQREIEAETVAFCWHAAKLSDAVGLANFCLNFMALHWTDVKHSEAFVALSDDLKREVMDVVTVEPTTTTTTTMTTTSTGKDRKYVGFEKAK